MYMKVNMIENEVETQKKYIINTNDICCLSS